MFLQAGKWHNCGNIQVLHESLLCLEFLCCCNTTESRASPFCCEFITHLEKREFQLHGEIWEASLQFSKPAKTLNIIKIWSFVRQTKAVKMSRGKNATFCFLKLVCELRFLFRIGFHSQAPLMLWYMSSRAKDRLGGCTIAQKGSFPEFEFFCHGEPDHTSNSSISGCLHTYAFTCTLSLENHVMR